MQSMMLSGGRRLRAAAWAAWAAACLLVAGCGGPALFTLQLPLEGIQKGIEEKFPISPKGEGGGGGPPLEATLSKPVVALDEAAGRVVLTLSLEVKLPNAPGAAPPDAAPPELPGPPDLPGPPGGPPFGPPGGPPPGSPAGAPSRPQPQGPGLPSSIHGKLVLSGKPEFDAAKKSLFIRDVQATSLVLDGLPPAVNEPVRKMAQEKASEKFAEPLPVPSDSATDVGKAFVKQIRVGKSAILIDLGF